MVLEGNTVLLVPSFWPLHASLASAHGSFALSGRFVGDGCASEVGYCSLADEGVVMAGVEVACWVGVLAGGAFTGLEEAGLVGVPAGLEDACLVGVRTGLEDACLDGVLTGLEEACLVGVPAGVEDACFVGRDD